MEMKSKGRRTYGKGDWVTGYLVSGGLFGGNESSCWIFYDKHFVEIIPETIGIFTKWVDANQKELYTGDQIEIEWRDGTTTLETVTYDEYYGYFKYGNNPLCELKDPIRNFVIVGNIHELQSL